MSESHDLLTSLRISPETTKETTAIFVQKYNVKISVC